MQYGRCGEAEVQQHSRKSFGSFGQVILGLAIMIERGRNIGIVPCHVPSRQAAMDPGRGFHSAQVFVKLHRLFQILDLLGGFRGAHPQQLTQTLKKVRPAFPVLCTFGHQLQCRLPVLGSLFVGEHSARGFTGSNRIVNGLVDIAALAEMVSKFRYVRLHIRYVKLFQRFSDPQVEPGAVPGVEFIGKRVADQSM